MRCATRNASDQVSTTSIAECGKESAVAKQIFPAVEVDVDNVDFKAYEFIERAKGSAPFLATFFNTQVPFSNPGNV